MISVPLLVLRRAKYEKHLGCQQKVLNTFLTVQAEFAKGIRWILRIFLSEAEERWEQNEEQEWAFSWILKKKAPGIAPIVFLPSATAA